MREGEGGEGREGGGLWWKEEGGRKEGYGGREREGGRSGRGEARGV